MAVDFFYLSMPPVLDIGDGSQDALLVRVRAGDHVGWGECEAASPAWSAPYPTAPANSVQDSELGQRVDSAGDIRAIGEHVSANSLDLLQANHTCPA